MTVLNIRRGDDEEFDLTLLDEDGNSLPVGSSYLSFTVKEFFSQSDSEALIRKEIGDGIEVIDNNAGLVALTVAAADTVSPYFPGTRKGLLWDLSLTTAGGKRKTLDSGTLNVTADITRD